MIVKCVSHPQLYIYDLKVHFVAGQAEVDTETAEKLKSMKGFAFEFSDTPTPPPASPLAGMDVEALKAYAKERGIDIGNATSESGIRKKIQEAPGYDAGQ